MQNFYLWNHGTLHGHSWNRQVVTPWPPCASVYLLYCGGCQVNEGGSPYLSSELSRDFGHVRLPAWQSGVIILFPSNHIPERWATRSPSAMLKGLSDLLVTQGWLEPETEAKFVCQVLAFPTKPHCLKMSPWFTPQQIRKEFKVPDLLFTLGILPAIVEKIYV